MDTLKLMDTLTTIKLDILQQLINNGYAIYIYIYIVSKYKIRYTK